MDDVLIRIAQGSQYITLPILPDSYDISDTWENQTVNINSIGLINMIGKRGLRSVTINSFFPCKEYSALESPGGTISEKLQWRISEPEEKQYLYNPWGLVEKIRSWRGKVLTFSISGTNGRVSWPCVIDGDFTYGEKDGSGDVYYSLTLSEYKKTNTKRTVAKPNVPKNYVTKKGDTLNKICQKFFGSTKNKKKLYTKNKKAVTKAFKKYMKMLSKAQKQKYKKKSKYNKPLPKGIKLTVKV